MKQLLEITSRINWYSVWLIMLIIFFVKICWYSNFAFGRKFMRHFNGNCGLFISYRLYIYVIGSVVEFAMVAISSILFCWMGVNTVLEGVMLGFLAFMMMFMVLLMCFLIDSRLLDVLMINASYFFFISLSTGGVLGWLT